MQPGLVRTGPLSPDPAATSATCRHIRLDMSHESALCKPHARLLFFAVPKSSCQQGEPRNFHSAKIVAYLTILLRNNAEAPCCPSRLIHAPEISEFEVNRRCCARQGVETATFGHTV